MHIADRIIATVIAFAVLVGVPTMTNFAVSQYYEIHDQLKTVENTIHVKDFYIEELDPDTGELVINWERCVDEYLIGNRNYELYQQLNTGQSVLIAKSPTKEIDFNQGCRLWRIEADLDNWDVRRDLNPGTYDIILQVKVSFDDDKVDTATFQDTKPYELVIPTN